LDQGRWRSGGSFGRGFEREDGTALADPLADTDMDLSDATRGRCRHFHAGLVRLERNERIVRVDRVARLDVDLDDRHIFEVADIRHRYFGGSGGLCLGECCHACSSGAVSLPTQTLAGLALSGSISYWRIASAAREAGMVPSSAS